MTNSIGNANFGYIFIQTLEVRHSMWSCLKCCKKTNGSGSFAAP